VLWACNGKTCTWYQNVPDKKFFSTAILKAAFIFCISYKTGFDWCVFLGYLGHLVSLCRTSSSTVQMKTRWTSCRRIWSGGTWHPPHQTHWVKSTISHSKVAPTAPDTLGKVNYITLKSGTHHTRYNYITLKSGTHHTRYNYITLKNGTHRTRRTG
jgi:hypothetical protein